MEEERDYWNLDETEFTRFLEGQRVIGQFPCSMSKPWFYLNMLLRVAFYFIPIEIFFGILVAIFVIRYGGDLWFIFIGLAMFPVMIVIIFLFMMPSYYKEWISGNKVKLTDQGIQIFMRPYAKGPIFRNFIHYDHIVEIGPKGPDGPNTSIFLNIISPTGVVPSSHYKKGQLFLPNTKEAGLLSARFDRSMPIRFGDFTMFNVWLESMPIVEGGETIIRRTVITDKVHFDVEAKYHDKFLEVFHKLKKKSEFEMDND